MSLRSEQKKQDLAESQGSDIAMPRPHDPEDETLSSPTKAELATFIEARSMSFSGPIPHPSLLAQYNDVVPDAADRIIRMAEEQAIHRQYLEKKVVQSDVDRSKTGQVGAVLVTFFFTSLAAFLVEKGHPIEAVAIVGVNLSTLVYIFITGKKEQKKELEQKNKAVPEEAPAPTLPSKTNKPSLRKDRR